MNRSTAGQGIDVQQANPITDLHHPVVGVVSVELASVERA